MEIVTILYLVLIFITIYLYSLFLLIFFKNKKNLFQDSHDAKHLKSLTILIPAFNEEKTLGGTIESLLENGYPKKLLKIIVIDDGSKDHTAEVARSYPVTVFSKPNAGKAQALNFGLTHVTTELVGVVDADSFPETGALVKIVNKFKDSQVHAVTGTVRVRNQVNLLAKLQNIEYTLIAWARKLLEYIDSVYVTPGALSLYRTKTLKEIGGFDHNLMTEDIEVAWRILKQNYKVRMCLSARVFTQVPTTLRKWWRQRLRWDIGGLQTGWKHRNTFFRRKYGMLGLFVAPFFISAFVLSVLGFGLWTYLITRRILSSILRTYFSLDTNSPILQLQSLHFTPSVFTIFGISLLVVYLIYLVHGLKTLDKRKIPLSQKGVILFYLAFYLSLYPLVFIQALYRIARGKKHQW